MSEGVVFEYQSLLPTGLPTLATQSSYLLLWTKPKGPVVLV